MINQMSKEELQDKIREIDDPFLSYGHVKRLEELAKKEHTLYKDGDSNIPEQILDRNGQVALSMCKKCRRAEIDLEEPCDKNN